MNLGSRYYNTPRSVVGLPWGADDDNDDGGGMEGAEMVVEPEPELEHGGEADGKRKVLMVDMTNERGGGEDNEGEKGVGGMDVDG